MSLPAVCDAARYTAWSTTGERPGIDLAELERLHAGGWWLFPLPVGVKFPPPVGVTGRDARRLDLDQVRRRYRAGVFGNAGTAMPPGVVGVDVDIDDDTRDLPPVYRFILDAPPTVVIRNRLRGPEDAPTLCQVSGTYLYRGELPDGRKWRAGVGRIDTIRPGHRYTVLPGSVHPSGRVYRAVYFSGAWSEHDPAHYLPDVDDLPFIGAGLLDYLTAPLQSAPPVRSTVHNTEHADAIAGDPCLCERMAEELDAVHAPGRTSNHSHYLGVLARVYAAHRAGHRGRDRAVDILRGYWSTSVGNADKRGGEFDDLVRWIDAEELAKHGTTEVAGGCRCRRRVSR